MLHELLTAGIFVYAALILWIIVPSGPMPCQTTEPLELAQQNVTLGQWEMQFISERFCQCFESENKFLRTLPLLAAACMLALLLLLDQLDVQFRLRVQHQGKQETYHVLCRDIRLYKLPKAGRYILVVIAMTSYTALTVFTHRPVHGFRPFDVNTAHGGLHYTATSVFFACFVLLYANAVWDFAYISNKSVWVSWFHTMTLTGMLVLSSVFAIFALYLQEDTAILIEYMLFLWIVLAVPVWIVLLYSPKVYEYAPMQPGALSTIQRRALSIYDLNVDIL